MTRSYKLKIRGERQDQTRQKIVEAAIHLHQTKGLSSTSIQDIADQAKVGKVTVYRHFPDMAAMIGACSGQYFARHPFPDPDLWINIEAPKERLLQGLKSIYAYHAETAPMMTKVYAEARDNPVMEPYHAHWRRMAEVLLDGWEERGQQKAFLKAAIGLALDFETWRNLTHDQGLTNNKAVKLMARLTCDCLDD